jgi:hypothetical protein
MDRSDLADRLGTPATRRTVVKTGAKLAYAAPLVAASFRLAAMDAAAQVSPGGGPILCEPGHGACPGSPACQCAPVFSQGPTGPVVTHTCVHVASGPVADCNEDSGFSCPGDSLCVAGTQCFAPC